MVRQRNRRICSGHGFFASFDASWPEWSWINLFSKETQKPFSDLSRFKNPILDFLKETHPYIATMISLKGEKLIPKPSGSNDPCYFGILTAFGTHKFRGDIAFEGSLSSERKNRYMKLVRLSSALRNTRQKFVKTSFQFNFHVTSDWKNRYSTEPWSRYFR